MRAKLRIWLFYIFAPVQTFLTFLILENSGGFGSSKNVSFSAGNKGGSSSNNSNSRPGGGFTSSLNIGSSSGGGGSWKPKIKDWEPVGNLWVFIF